MKSEKTIGAIVIGVIAFVIAAVIVFASVMNSNGVVTANGNLMEDFGAKRVSKGRLSEEFKESYDNFCLGLIDSAAQTKENVAFSPSSVMSATALLASGADNLTKTELEKALGMKAQDAGKQLGILEGQTAFQEESGLKQSTTMWLNTTNPFNIKKRFLKGNAKYYGLGVRRESFNLENIEDLVNEPIAAANDGSALSSLKFGSEDCMNIISGASFLGKWKNPTSADSLSLGLFSGSLSEQECDFFSSVEDKYIVGNTFTGAIKELEDGYSFVGLLPKNDGGASYYGVADVTRELRVLGFGELIKNAKSQKVNVTLPQYSNNSRIPVTTNLNQALMNMGVKEIMTSKADLSNTATNSYNLHLDNVAVSGDIIFSATGCCGAKSGGKEVTAEDLRKNEYAVRFDSSFVYFIYHNESGLPIYCGILNQIS